VIKDISYNATVWFTGSGVKKQRLNRIPPDYYRATFKKMNKKWKTIRKSVRSVRWVDRVNGGKMPYVLTTRLITVLIITILTNVYQALALLPVFKLAKQQHPCMRVIVSRYFLRHLNSFHLRLP